jgi:hypothetical protein
MFLATKRTRKWLFEFFLVEVHNLGTTYKFENKHSKNVVNFVSNHQSMYYDFGFFRRSHCKFVSKKELGKYSSVSYNCVTEVQFLLMMKDPKQAIPVGCAQRHRQFLVDCFVSVGTRSVMVLNVTKKVVSVLCIVRAPLIPETR